MAEACFMASLAACVRATGMVEDEQVKTSDGHI